MRAQTPRPKTTPAADSPGNWRHPRLDEITKRRAASVFTEADLRTAVYNGLALGAVFVARTATWSTYQQLCRVLRILPPQYAGPFWALLELLLVANIVRALLPLFRHADPMADIPLTPGQRRLLGLQPLRGSGPPGAVYTTPPRYARTPSLAGSAGSAGSTGSASSSFGSSTSPSSPSSTLAISGSHSYLGSPITSSPLYSKTRARTHLPLNASINLPGTPFARGRRSSIGAFASPDSLGASRSSLLDSVSSIGSPSPAAGKRLSVGLNNKWLYEKTRRSSSSSGRIY